MCMCVYLCVCMYVCVCVCMYVCMYVCVYVCMFHLCMFECMYKHTIWCEHTYCIYTTSVLICYAMKNEKRALLYKCINYPSTREKNSFCIGRNLLVFL